MICYEVGYNSLLFVLSQTACEFFPAVVVESVVKRVYAGAYISSVEVLRLHLIFECFPLLQIKESVNILLYVEVILSYDHYKTN